MFKINSKLKRLKISMYFYKISQNSILSKHFKLRFTFYKYSVYTQTTPKKKPQYIITYHRLKKKGNNYTRRKKGRNWRENILLILSADFVQLISNRH